MTAPCLLSRACVGVAGATLAAHALATGLHATARVPDAAVPCPPVSAFVVTADHYYRLAVRVRPLLFWIRRDNVGDARLTWSSAPGGATRLELLIGSDPARAPMRVNRWGYLAECACGATSTVVGVMTESDEQSVDEARARLQDGGHAFKAIRAVITPGQSLASVTRVQVDEDLTYRDLATLLRRVPEAASANRRLAIDENAGQGFLMATAALVRDGVGSYGLTRRVDAGEGASRRYVHGDRAFDLRARRNSLAKGLRPAAVASPPLIDTEFEVRNPATGDTSTFRLVYAASGPLAGVPVRIVYRPRWWFEAELQLTGEPAGHPPSRGDTR